MSAGLKGREMAGSLHSFFMEARYMKANLKRLMTFVLLTALIFALPGCQSAGRSSEAVDLPAKSTSEPTGQSNADNNQDAEIALIINGNEIAATLNRSKAAKSLYDQLPITVSLNDSDNDFCGGTLDIDYDSSEVHNGYQNGELAYWPPAKNFVIFRSGEESSADTGNIVTLGQIKNLDDLAGLSGTIEVQIIKRDAGSESEETEATSPADTEKNGNDTQAGSVQTEADNKTNSSEEVPGMIIKITAGEYVITATLYDNAAGRALWDKLPITLPMMNLYGREMCYRFGAGGLPDDDAADTGYAIGDISYWPPAGSLVILYKQNGEVFEQQLIGHTDDDISFFDGMPDTDITFEKAE